MKLSLKPGNSEILINKELKNELLSTKNKIDEFYNFKIRVNNRYQTSKWEYYRSLLNKYETIPKHKGKMNRAYFKLQEMMIDDENKFKKLKTVATLAEGPGGFIQYITDNYPDAQVYGITLRYESEQKAQNRHMKEFANKNVKIIYGDPDNPLHDGNLYNPDVVKSFAEQVGKVDLVTADGGFEASNENDKEIEHLKLFLSETLTAFRVLKKGGSFILKIYDIFTRPTIELLFLLSNTFKTVSLKKPVSSRPANSERYVVCHGFKNFDINEHVDLNKTYSSILELTPTLKTKFQTFIYNLEIENQKYVQRVINTINEIVNYIQVNEQNNVEKKNKENEQQMYKEVWEKVYEKNN